ncbi:hypothetical protein B0H14DRAFT_2617937 [Mycena olivaceomarginata]|nr:hypothetical protein B0H14DRAFT_2617937 [Mycena olivaceomarginata]
MQTIQLYTKYNILGNSPNANQDFIPYEPHGYHAFALANNARDNSDLRWGTFDSEHGCLNFVTEGRIATLVDMMARGVDKSAGARENGQDAIVGRDRARRRAMERQRAAKDLNVAQRDSDALNGPEIQALRLQRQRELEKHQGKPADGPSGSGTGGGAPEDEMPLPPTRR